MNGEPLLSVEYDEKDNSETVYGRGRDRLLTVRYDSSGRPVRAIPAGPLDGLNVTYDSRGRVTAWWRGDLAGSSVYDDRTGLPVEQRLANKILRRFIYKAGNKVCEIPLASVSHVTSMCHMTADNRNGEYRRWRSWRTITIHHPPSPEFFS